MSKNQADSSSQARFPTDHWISSLLAVVTLIQSAVGAFHPHIFRDPAMTVGNARGTEVVILFVALPVLVASMVLAQRDSLRAQVTWAGALTYIAYNAVIFAFATAFNPLFLLYVATLSLAVWSLVAFLHQVDVDAIRAQKEYLEQLLKKIEKLGQKKEPPEAVENLIAPFLTPLKIPANRRKQYTQRLRYGLYHYYGRHYHPASNISGEE